MSHIDYSNAVDIMYNLLVTRTSLYFWHVRTDIPDYTSPLYHLVELSMDSLLNERNLCVYIEVTLFVSKPNSFS